MDSDAKQSVDTSFKLETWAFENRRLLIGLLCVAVVAIGGITAYSNYSKSKEIKAGEALSNLKAPVATPGSPAQQIPAADYLKVAGEHPGTSAASRAILMAAGSYFEAGKFKEAQTQFEKFLAEAPESPLMTQARLGVAASLEAQGNVTEAATKYKELTDRQPNDFVVPQAKSALARLYVTQGKPADALRLYEELAAANNNDSWTMEATIQKEELLTKHPELKKPVTPPAAAVTPALTAPKPAITLTNPASTNK